MPTKAPGMPAHAPAPGLAADTVTEPVDNGSSPPAAPDIDPAQGSAATLTGTETRGEHFRRQAHRTRLQGYAVITVAVVAFLIALGASNTAQVKFSWVFGSARLSLVWLLIFTAILGWLLGNLASTRLHWRTRAPRARRGEKS